MHVCMHLRGHAPRALNTTILLTDIGVDLSFVFIDVCWCDRVDVLLRLVTRQRVGVITGRDGGGVRGMLEGSHNLPWLALPRYL